MALQNYVTIHARLVYADLLVQLENVFMKHYAPNYTLVSKQNISQIKAKPKSRIIFSIIFSNPVASTN